MVSTRLRRATATTPGRLRALSLVAVATLILLGVLAVSAVSHRQAGLRAVGNQSEPLIVDAQSIDTFLSQADAVAANAFLSGGIEPADVHAQYLTAVAAASQTVADAAQRSGTTATERDALRLLAQQIPVYTGLVETARANNRQGYPVGAAYLRQANQLMTKTILPATQRLFAFDADRLEQGQRSARSTTDAGLVGLGAVVALVALVATQIWMRRRTNRILNIRLLVATVLVVVGVGASVSALASESSSVSESANRGYAVLNLVAQSRIAAFRAKSDESFTLIGRGNGTAFDDDFNAQAKQLTSLIGLAGNVSTTHAAHQAALASASAASSYLSVHAQIRKFDNGGKFDSAVMLAVGSTAGTANQAFTTLDGQLNQTLLAGQDEFSRDLGRARGAVANLKVLLLLTLIAAAALVLWGAQQRINEYR
jgi:hypothetical protein